jgi:hypothetical protein
MSLETPFARDPYLAALTTLLSLLLALIVGQSASAGQLQPYDLQYTTRAYGMTVTINRSLHKEEPLWRLESSGGVMLAGFQETARFAVASEQVFPGSYVFRGRGLAGGRPREVYFDHGSESIRSLHKGTWYDLPYRPDILDRLSQQEQLRLWLMRADDPRQDVELTVADGRKLKHYRILYRGEAAIETPLGSVATLHFERDREWLDGNGDEDETSEIWVAPVWDYLIVRMLHSDDGRPVEALLSGGTVGGKPLSLPADQSLSVRRQ